MAKSLKTEGKDIWKYIGVGIAVSILAPLASSILAMTVIGIPLAILICSLFVIALLFGVISIAIYFGDIFIKAINNGKGLSIVWTMITGVTFISVVSLLSYIPIVGRPVVNLLYMLLIVTSLGAVTVNMKRVFPKVKEAMK